MLMPDTGWRVKAIMGLDRWEGGWGGGGVRGGAGQWLGCVGRCYLGEHAFLIQQGQDAHRLGWASLNQVQALLVVLKLHSRPVHPL
jgi:hypothetical protein